MKHSKRIYLFFLPYTLCLAISVLSLVSCTTIDLYEKTVNIPGHAWQNSFRPTFEFVIKDTTALYQPYLVLRHNEKYNFNNIYINLYIQGPGQDTAQKFPLDLSLATNEKGWKATGMDDIYEHRIGLDIPKRLKAGNYKFTLEQIMRENPLQHVFDAGVRVEKK
ncbi:MAG: gliding motility lipoprotein GldH [Chitinophagales bacterium]